MDKEKAIQTIIKNHSDRLTRLKARYERKYYNATTPEEILRVNEWLEKEEEKVQREYLKELKGVML